MGEIPVSRLPIAQLPLSGNELVMVVQNGTSKRTTAAQLTSAGGTVYLVDVIGSADISATGGPITTQGSFIFSLINTAVSPGTYTNANITVDAKGRITSASNGSTTPTAGGSVGQVQYNNAGSLGGFTVGGDGSLNTSTGTFTITNNAVTNEKAAQMPANTIKGNNTGVSANSIDLTPEQVTSMLSVFGSGLKGLVPAPAAYPTSAKYLSEDGTFSIPAGGSVTSVGMTVPTGLSVSGSPITTAGTLAVTLASGYVIPTQATLDGKQGTITLTTTGTTGAATLIGNTLNIPQYGGGSVWGSITGTLSAQTDLQSALNAKQDSITTGTTSQYFRGDLSLATFPTNVSSFTNDSGYITASSTSTLTNKDLSSGTNTFPTFNQNTTGSAAKWTTARSLAGNSVDGSANVTFANKFIVQGTSDAGLSAAQFLGSLTTGILKNTTTTGVLSIAVAGTDYQEPITLTTTGTSGAATLIGNTLNIPQYSGGGGGGTWGSITGTLSAQTDLQTALDAKVDETATSGADSYTISAIPTRVLITCDNGSDQGYFDVRKNLASLGVSDGVNDFGVFISSATGKTAVYGTIYADSYTASQLLATDGSKNLQSLSTATYPSLTELSYVKGANSAIQTQINNLKPNQKTFYMSAGSDVTIPLFQKSTQAFTISSIKGLQTASGTITASIKINGTNVTGLSSLSATSTPQDATATAANTVSVGDQVTLVLASNSSAVDLAFTLGYTL